MATTAEANTHSDDRPSVFQPEAGIGLPIAVGTFGFSVLMLGIPNAGLITGEAAMIFVAVVFGTGAFGLFIGGLMEYRANNIFGGTFALFYSAFLLTTAIMLRVFAAEMDSARLWCSRFHSPEYRLLHAQTEWQSAGLISMCTAASNLPRTAWRQASPVQTR